MKRSLVVNAVVISNLLCALVYLTLTLLLTVHSERRPTALFLAGACATTSAWALAVALHTGLGVQLGPTSGVLEVLCTVLWLGFLRLAYRAGLPEGESARDVEWLLVPAAVICLGLASLEFFGGALASQAAEDPFLFVPRVCGHLLVVMAGLIVVEALFRRAPSESRWRIKHLYIGIGGILAYDLFVYSHALLFHRMDPILDSSRGAVSAVVAPLIAIAAARNPTWSVQLNLSRRAVFHSAVLVGVGIYMIGLAGMGTALRMLEGDWARLVQVTFLFAAFLLLIVLFFSGAARSFFKLQLSKYLFTYRHDYREQWQRLGEALFSGPGSTSLQERALRAIAGVVDSRSGGLWLRESEAFSLRARMTLPDGATDEPAGGRFLQELGVRRDGILELGARGDGADRPVWLPAWLRRWQEAWLPPPLVHRNEVIGFVVLGRSPGLGCRRLHPEDEELLLIVARQAASPLAEEQTMRALAEARRFDELSKHMAFIAHDLRNLANELGLMLSNARRHIQNPDFQRDLLTSMENSVAGMQRLLDQLRGSANEPAKAGPTELRRLLGNSMQVRLPEKPEVRLDLDGKTPLWVAGDPDRLVAISGHLIRNAIEAVGPGGRVGASLRRAGDEALFEVVDDGPGMSAECVRERLCHPFGTAKDTGLGLGLFECRQLARELGGDLIIESQPGSGTVARLRLPLLVRKGGEMGQKRRDVS